MNAMVESFNPNNAVDLQLELMDRIREACETLKYMPDREMQFLSSGNRICMPPIIRSFWENYGLEPARKPRLPPSHEAVDRMSETFEWLMWLGKQWPREMKILWLCFGMEMQTMKVARHLKCSRMTVFRDRKSGIAHLAAHVYATHLKAA